MNIFIDKNGNLFDGDTCNVDGMVKCQLDTDGKPYPYYLLDGTPDVAKCDAKKLEDLVKAGMQLVKQYIQSTVDAYNEAHGVDFESVDSCNKYKDISTYTHQQFCIDIIEHNAAVWDKSRAIQVDVVSGTIPTPTDAEFIAMLPTYGGVM